MKEKIKQLSIDISNIDLPAVKSKDAGILVTEVETDIGKIIDKLNNFK